MERASGMHLSAKQKIHAQARPCHCCGRLRTDTNKRIPKNENAILKIPRKDDLGSSQLVHPLILACY
jgi:hypothetical protein